MRELWVDDFPLRVLRKQFCAHGIFSRGARCSFMSSHQSKCINSSCVIKLFCILLMHNWVKSPQHYDLAICFCRKWFKIVLGKCVTLFTETRFFSFPLFFAFFKKKKAWIKWLHLNTNLSANLQLQSVISLEVLPHVSRLTQECRQKFHLWLPWMQWPSECTGCTTPSLHHQQVAKITLAYVNECVLLQLLHFKGTLAMLQRAFKINTSS